MRLVTPATILTALVICSPGSALLVQSTGQPTARDLDGLVGQVKRIDEEVAEMKMKAGRMTESSRRRSSTVIYDRQGRMTQRWLSLNGFDSTDQSFSYDKNNIRHKRYSIFDPLVNSTGNRSIEQLSVSVFHFDATENALREEVYVGDKPEPQARTQSYKYRFDSSRRLIEKISYTLQGTVAGRDVYTYGTDHNPTERKLFSAGNPTPQVIKYTYTLDLRGNWIKRVAENTLANPARTQTVEVTYRKVSYY